jgi:hypothetical protein
MPAWFTCSVCSAVVVDADAHAAWHVQTGTDTTMEGTA